MGVSLLESNTSNRNGFNLNSSTDKSHSYSSQTNGSNSTVSDIIINLNNDTEWPSIGVKANNYCSKLAQSHSSGSKTTNSMSITTLTNCDQGADTSSTSAVNVMAATTQSSPLSLQGQTGAPTSRSSDNLIASSSVINTSSSGDVLDQSATSQDQPWLDNSSMSGWDKQAGLMQSNPSTPRLDGNAQSSNNQFSGWGQPPFPATFSSDVSSTTNWGTSVKSNMQSTWGSQSPSLIKQQAMPSEWGSSSAANSSQWGASNNESGDDLWGQPKCLPNVGTDGWGQPTSTSQSNPSSAGAQSSQWGQPTSDTSPSSVWPTSGDVSNQQVPVTSVPSSLSTTSTASKQWGATSGVGQMSMTSPTSTVSATGSSSTPTSWAGAAAKGLPKVQAKPPEPIDPVQLQIEQSINNPEGWGRVPVRQDTSWGKPPEKKNQDDSNQWQAAPNNGTAIWESSKSGNSQTAKFDDKSTWNQKVAGNTDPNVWNGEGSKGKDNALWDDVSTSKELEISNDQNSTWNSKGPSRTVSQSSGGDNQSDSSWTGPLSAPGNRSGSPNSLKNQPSVANVESGWTASNGAIDPRKISRWDSNPAPPMRINSTSDVDIDSPSHSNSIMQYNAVQTNAHAITTNMAAAQPPLPRGGTSLWDSSTQQNKAGSGWSSKSQMPWVGENSSSTSSHAWGQPQPNVAGGWGDSSAANNQWNSSNRKSSFAWDDGTPNGDLRDRRQFKSESDASSWDDTDMGDWNESNCVWSSVGGFKQPRRQGAIPENASTHMSSKQFGNGGPNMNANNGGMHGGQNPTKQQMLQMLVQMGFPKEDAHTALIQNDLNLQGAIGDLLKSNNMPQQGPGGPSNDFKYNPNIPPPGVVSNPLNTPFNSNAQLNQSVQTSRINKANQPRNPLGPGRTNSVQQQQQQRMIVQQLQLGVQMNNIHPSMLNLPLTEQTLRSIQQLLNLQQTYQHNHDQLIQLQRRSPSANAMQIDHLNQVLMGIKHQMKTIQQPLLGGQVPRMNHNETRGLDMSSLSLGPGTIGHQTQQPQSRLGIWTDKAPGSKQGAFTSSQSLHTSNSTPNLQGGVLGDNNPWSASSSSAVTGWSSMSPNSQFLDNHNESHSANSASQSPPNRPSSQSAASNSSQNSFDIPEFVPGQPWQGANVSKIEDDPNITPAIARSISSTASVVNVAGRTNGDLDWGNNLGRTAWSSQNTSTLGGESWSKSTRPPPGLSKNINRSMSMPQGPSEKTSAFSPVTSGWDKQSSLNGGSPWLVIRNLTPQIDGATLKTLCSQHGPLLNFFVNQNNGQALIQYATKQEGLKAHNSLNSCVLGNTTIMTEFIDESEAQRIIEPCQRPPSIGRSTSMSAAPGSAMWPSSNSGSSLWSNSITPANNTTWGDPTLLDNHMLQPFLTTNDFPL